ncbi:MAG: hypothetical protein K2P81_09350 [Bacteriovoracaceae bacterium]|nr:hypothetical protein [Bacteriovoracaceae bacterium]
MKTFLLFIALCISPVKLLQAAPYSMVDLESLEKEKNYNEFFAHALDIRPSERNEYWKTMVQNMGEGYIKFSLTKNRLAHDDLMQIEKLMSWSVLKDYDFFRIKRQEFGFKWISQCLKENSSPDSSCWQDLVSFWEKDRQEPDLAPRLLTLLTPYLPLSEPLAENPAHRARLMVTPYFILSPVIHSSLAEFQCKKPEVQNVVKSKLMSEWKANYKPVSFTQILKTVAHESCWKALVESSHGQWAHGASEDELHLSYLLLKAENALTPLEQDLFYINYLLSAPSRGEIFNMAWNRLQELSRDSQRREKILDALKGWSPLPGGLFADLDLAKRNAIARLFQKNFPEYIDHYALTCIDYYGGKKRFPDGNPALNCRELFEIGQSIHDLLPESSVKLFNQTI